MSDQEPLNPENLSSGIGNVDGVGGYLRRVFRIDYSSEFSDINLTTPKMRETPSMQSNCDHEQIIASIKRGQVYETPVIIKSDSGLEIGRMVPITWDMANNRQIHENLARWRMQYMHFFLTYFEANADNTETFLKKYSLPDNRRLLFLMQDCRGKMVGNFGICNLIDNTAELDNMIRGENVEAKGFMYFAQISLMHWCNRIFRTTEFYLHVLGNNRRTIEHHQRIGFEIVGSYALEKQETLDGYRLIKAAESGINSELTLLKMSRGFDKRLKA